MACLTTAIGPPMVQSHSYVSEKFPQAFGRYQLKERLALGGMAELFLAEVEGAHGFAKSVVIKRILPSLAQDSQFTSMFISEAKFTAQLSHPNIAQTLELCNEGKQLFIVMEYIDGLDVLALLRECAHRRSRVPAELSVYIIKEVLDALDFAHKLRSEDGKPLGIVHRDVSPSNIILSTRGDVKLIDFGIAHALAETGKANSGTLKGKYGYMSPEQVLGQAISPQSDIFAAGVVLAEMLMGRRLFAAANELDVLLMVRDVELSRLDRFGKHIESGLENFLRWALRKNPEDRYRDAGVFRDVLDEWLFEQRHRVSSSQLADIVASLYEDALARRKENIKNSPLVHAAELEDEASEFDDAIDDAIESAMVDSAEEGRVRSMALGTDRSAPFFDPLVDGEESPKELMAGVPTGLAERAPSDGPSIEIEVSSDPESQGYSRAASPRADTAVASPSSQDKRGERSRPVAMVLEPLPILEDTIVADNAKEIESSSGFPGYDSISAAVASVSPLAPDPASKEFDDSNITGEEPRPSLMPTAAQIASTPPKRAETDGEDDSAEHSGSLKKLSALGTLYRTTANRASGKVVLTLGGVKKVIYFKKGIPEFVSSNIASELFGAYLVRTEVIGHGELDMALAVMPHFSGKLGDTLVGLGLMKPLEVFRHLTRQVRSKLIEVCTWTQGEYEWYPGAQCPAQSFPLDLDALEVYGAGAMATPRSSLELWCKQNNELRPIGADVLSVSAELFQVSGIGECLRSFTGNKSVGEIFAETPNSKAGLHRLRLLFLLLNTRLLVDVEIHN